MRLIIILICAVLIVCMSGPLLHFTPTPVAMDLPISSAEQVDEYVAQGESKVVGIRPGLAKSVVWSNMLSRKPSNYSIVYLHGFTASRRDISPVVERLAGDLGANVFFTRLKAHGLQTGDEFANVKAVDWYNDAREAFAIGKLIGQQVILVGTSTGGLLATLLSLDREAQKSIAALILLSPNFGLKDWRVKFISGPLGKYLAHRLVGVDRITAASNEGHASAWTHRWRSDGIVPLMDLTNFIQDKKLDDILVPTLILYTSKDEVLDIGSIKWHFDSMVEARKKMIDVPGGTRHELTGEILGPETVAPVVQSIEAFLQGLGIAFPSLNPQAGVTH